VTLDALRCFDRLVVGELSVAPRRIKAVYRIERGSHAESCGIHYAFDSDVLDPAEERDRNLAALCAAQVALNYGLFCDEIRFDLPLDETDLAFLREAARNTATEIYVNKIARENPFLVPEVAELPFERRDDYLRARIRAETRAPLRPGWEGRPDVCVVLSSGGKESLLTYGLLREAGVHAVPVFFNESGRHWYTALNAYRRLSREEPRTRRVWGDTDRLFAWMARRLPILRRDFHSVRSDEYPVRLWTVAVMVLAALPFARREGAGRILIGDEHDTSRLVDHCGVTHHDGLYDQSVWFDESLTRYYLAKGMGARQLSLLRPLSEILVEKVLAERYPDLLDLQTSCHAAHVAAGRVLPCGYCEKCRRIMAMLTALGVDARRLGYSDEQLVGLADALARRPLHQELPGYEHVLWKLETERGYRFPEEGIGPERVRPRERPEIESLRFQDTVSPVDLIPEDLRGPVLRALLAHARGAVRWDGERWAPFAPGEERAAGAAGEAD
jgi:hypothetical protein